MAFLTNLLRRLILSFVILQIVGPYASARPGAQILRVAKNSPNSIDFLSSNWDKYEGEVKSELMALQTSEPSSYEHAVSVLGGSEVPSTFDSAYAQNALKLLSELHSNVVNEKVPEPTQPSSQETGQDSYPSSVSEDIYTKFKPTEVPVSDKYVSGGTRNLCSLSSIMFITLLTILY